jgi:hypothetical protein
MPLRAGQRLIAPRSSTCLCRPPSRLALSQSRAPLQRPSPSRGQEAPGWRRTKPRCREPVPIPKPLVFFDEFAAIIAESLAVSSVAGKGWLAFPRIGKAPEAAYRKRFSQTLLEPATRWRRFHLPHPAIARNVPKLVAELIGKLDQARLPISTIIQAVVAFSSCSQTEGGPEA